uniref:Uncharacterized protein n=1 Tax=Anguilla anguilla TaxID=7936 RepID=A0A0E9RB45_ANGAN
MYFFRKRRRPLSTGFSTL